MGTSAGCCFRLKIGHWTLEWGVEAGYATTAKERCGRGAPAITASMEEKKNSMCCCYPKDLTQAPAVAVTMTFLSSVVGTGRHISKNTSKVDL
jgi:hypothetical protein